MRFTPSLLFLLFIVSFIFISGRKKVGYWARPEIIFPEDNPGTDESANFGASLFFETLLSRDTSISCQSCHLITEAFADHLPVGEGVDKRKVTRNTPTIFNTAFHPYYMRDGKFKTLEEQVIGPINDHREFDLSPEEVVERLKTVPIYNRLSQEVYGQELDITVVQRAIANFERFMVSDHSAFDDFMRGDKHGISSDAKAGYRLFSSPKLGCTGCHNGYDFTDYSFQNNGLYIDFADSGRALMTHLREDIGKFKVPTLRNLPFTAPYMHDGSVETLEEVIDHYASGGKQHFNQSEKIQGFEITSIQKKQLVAFLHSLTEKRLLNRDE